MQEFNFISTLREVTSVTEFLFESGCVAIPVKFYSDSSYEELESQTKLLMTRSPGWHTYLFTNKVWGGQSFEVDPVDNVHVGKVFVIGAKRGPPNIQLSYLDNMNISNVDDVVSGLITTYEEFWPQNEVIKAPPALRTTYAQLTKMIRNRSIRYVTPQVIWVTEAAREQIDMGKVPMPTILAPKEERRPNGVAH